MESVWILKPFADHFQLSTFQNSICFNNILGCNATSKTIIAELKERDEIMKSGFLSTASDDRLDGLMIIALHKYISENDSQPVLRGL